MPPKASDDLLSVALPNSRWREILASSAQLTYVMVFTFRTTLDHRTHLADLVDYQITYISRSLLQCIDHPSAQVIFFAVAIASCLAADFDT